MEIVQKVQKVWYFLEVTIFVITIYREDGGDECCGNGCEFVVKMEWIDQDFGFDSLEWIMKV